MKPGLLYLFTIGLMACSHPLDVPQDMAPQIACAAITDQPTCAARPDCVADGCTICGAFQCYAIADAPTACAPVPCVIDCASRKTEADCNAVSSLCHSVFLDPGTCDCNGIDCCLMFDHCAEEVATCQEPAAASCPANDIVCVDTWATSYKNGCAEGYVHASDCNPI